MCGAVMKLEVIYWCLPHGFVSCAVGCSRRSRAGDVFPAGGGDEGGLSSMLGDGSRESVIKGGGRRREEVLVILKNC
jgi:hypothetical protein